MDTTTVNFAINKLTEGWHAVAPAIQDVGEKYVRYVVFQQITRAVTATLVLIVAAILSYVSLRKAVWDIMEANAWNVIAIVALVVAFGSGVAGVCYSHDAFLAVTNPEMFTIHSLIEAAKPK